MMGVEIRRGFGEVYLEGWGRAKKQVHDSQRIIELSAALRPANDSGAKFVTSTC